MLGLLWPDIREMLLTEMNFEEKYVRESVTEQIAKLKVRYGKNNIKRVIPGKSSLPNPKLRCVVRMVVYSILPHAKSGPNDHRKGIF